MLSTHRSSPSLRQTPLLPSFPLCRTPKRGQKLSSTVPFPFLLCSFSPTLKHAVASPVLP
jgi:hypothetical protein